MNIPEYLKRAENAIRQSEFDMAEHYYNQILTHSPANLDALEGLQNLKVLKARKNWSVITLYSKWITGWLLVMFGKAQQAYPDLELVYQYDKSHIRRAWLFAQCALKCGKLDTAHEVFSEILEHKNHYIPALRADAELLIQMDDLMGAKERFETLHRILPNHKQIAHDLRDISAKAYSKFGIPEKLTQRRAEMEKAQRQTPGTPEFKRKLNLLLEQYERNPSDDRLAVALAQHYREGGLHDESNRMLASVLDHDPAHQAARIEQARVWRASGELHLAVSLFKELLEADPQDQTLRDEYLEAQIQLQQSQPSVQSLDPKQEISQLQYERDLNQIQLLKQHIHAHPEAVKERIRLGQLYLKYERQEEAIPVLQRLIHDPVSAGRAYLLLGECFMKKGDSKLAINQFEKSLPYLRSKNDSYALTDEIKQAYYNMGQCYERLRDWDQARDSYGQVYSADIHYKDVRDRYENTFQQSNESTS